MYLLRSLAQIEVCQGGASVFKSILKSGERPADQETYLYYGGIGAHERQYQIPNFVGLALHPKGDREIKHDATDPLPYADNSIRKVQSQDVFEHLPKETIPAILDDIYRVLKPGGVFRLSVPDYRSPLLTRRSVYNRDGEVIADLMMGGSVQYDASTASAAAQFTTDGNAHIWFPKYETVLDLVIRSQIRKCSEIKFYQYFIDDKNYVVEEYPENEMHVTRSVPFDNRAGGAPISIVVDFIK